MLLFASDGVDFNVSDVFEEMIVLLRKIEMWWFVNVEMATDPDAYPSDLDLNEVTPGPMLSLQILVDVALGSEDVARKYYDHFMANS